MNKFLELSHKALDTLYKYDKIHIVLGNESCDLDSAISALVYAYFLYKHNYSSNCGCNSIAVPLLNINDDEFPLRTETSYFLTKHNISHNYLSFRNQIDLLKLRKDNKLILTLVDHHVLPLKDKDLIENVFEVIDHRPIDKSANLVTANVTIDPVGSCCTLVANKIIKANKDLLTNDLAHLLHGTIVLDTINFNKDAKRYKDLDVKMTKKLEELFNITTKREDIHNELVNARSDVSTLTPLQILHRDMKIVHGIPFPGVPMLFSEFLKLDQAVEALKQFCEKHEVKIIIPMGLSNKNNIVLRDIAVFALEDCDLKQKLIDTLKNNKDLQLIEVKTEISGLILFKQDNVTMSRKNIIPIVRNLLEKCNKIN